MQICSKAYLKKRFYISSNWGFNQLNIIGMHYLKFLSFWIYNFLVFLQDIYVSMEFSSKFEKSSLMGIKQPSLTLHKSAKNLEHTNENPIKFNWLFVWKSDYFSKMSVFSNTLLLVCFIEWKEKTSKQTALWEIWKKYINAFKVHEKLVLGLVREPPKGKSNFYPEMCTGPVSRYDWRWHLTVSSIQ